MTLRLAIAALGLAISGSVFSAVTISAPEEIAILAVNDQEVNAGLFRAKNNQYKVDAGETSLSVRYVQFFQHMNGEHDVVKSGVVTLKTPVLQDGENYKLALVNAPASFEAAKKYAEQPTIGLFNKNNQLLVEQTGANTEAKPWLTGGLFGRAYDLTQKKTAPVNQPAPVYTAVAQSAVTASSPNAVDQQLIQLWKKASKVERQKFMTWLAEQAQ